MSNARFDDDGGDDDDDFLEDRTSQLFQSPFFTTSDDHLLNEPPPTASLLDLLKQGAGVTRRSFPDLTSPFHASTISLASPTPPADCGSRTLGFVDCLSLVVGIIVGTGIFATPGRVLGYSGCVGLATLVWVAAGCYALLGSLIYSELGAAFPSSGGDYLFIGKGLSPLLGFVNVWGSALVLKPSAQVIQSLVISRYIAAAFFDVALASDPEVDQRWQVKLTAAAVLTLLAAVNYFGVRSGAVLQNVLLACKAAAMLLTVLMGVYSLAFGGTAAQFVDNVSAPFQLDASFSFANIATAVFAAQLSFNGWQELATVASDVKEPGKNIVRGAVGGTGIVFALYLAINAAYLMVLPKQQIIDSNAVAVTAAELVWGSSFASLMAALIASSALGSLNGSIIVGAQKIHAAATEGSFLLPGILAYKGDRGSPYPTLIFQLLVALLFLLPSDFGALVAVLGVTNFVFYILTAAALVNLRRIEPDVARPFKIWSPAVPVVFVLCSLAILVLSVFAPASRWATLFSLVALSTGVPFYFLFIRPSAPLSSWNMHFRLDKETDEPVADHQQDS